MRISFLKSTEVSFNIQKHPFTTREVLRKCSDLAAYIKLICFIKEFIKCQRMIFSFLMSCFHMLYNFSQDSKSDLWTASHSLIRVDVEFWSRRNRRRLCLFLWWLISNDLSFRFTFLLFNTVIISIYMKCCTGIISMNDSNWTMIICFWTIQFG